MKIIKLNEDHLESILQLQKEIIDHLPDKTLYYPTEKEAILNILTTKGLCCGIVEEDKVVACSTIYFPDKDENLGKGILVDSLCQLVCHKDFSLVHPEFRGLGLQVKMFKFLEIELKNYSYHYIMSTVSPKNPHSYKNLFKCEMAIIDKGLKYDGKERLTFIKKVI